LGFKTNRTTKQRFRSDTPTLKFKFEREIDDILTGKESDFYLQWQQRINSAKNEGELDAISRDLAASEISQSAKDIIFGLVARQRHEFVRRRQFGLGLDIDEFERKK
jgi:hypothetical protein